MEILPEKLLITTISKEKKIRYFIWEIWVFTLLLLCFFYQQILLVFGCKDAQSEAFEQAAKRGNYRCKMAHTAESAMDYYLKKLPEVRLMMMFYFVFLSILHTLLTRQYQTLHLFKIYFLLRWSRWLYYYLFYNQILLFGKNLLIFHLGWIII